MVSPTSARKFASSPPLSTKLLVIPVRVDPKPRGRDAYGFFRNDRQGAKYIDECFGVVHYHARDMVGAKFKKNEMHTVVIEKDKLVQNYVATPTRTSAGINWPKPEWMGLVVYNLTDRFIYIARLHPHRH